MSRIPEIAWPPSGAVTVEELYLEAMALKKSVYPEHTVQDPLDPYNSILLLIAALGSRARGQANNALKRLSVTGATSRKALLSMLSTSGRSLRPAMPAVGVVLCKAKSAPNAVSVVMVPAGTKVNSGSQDPVFTTFEDKLSLGSAVFPKSWHLSDDSEPSILAAAEVFDMVVGDRVTMGTKGFMADEMTLTLTTAHGSDRVFSLEYSNDTWGYATRVVVVSATELDVYLDGYLRSAEHHDTSEMVGLRVTVKFSPTDSFEYAFVELGDNDSPKIRVSNMGQSDPSLVAQNYQVFSEWLPVPNMESALDLTSSPIVVSVDPTDLVSQSSLWHEHPDYGFALAYRMVSGDDDAGVEFDAIEVDTSTVAWWLLLNVVQGVRSSKTLGETTGAPLQHLPLPSVLIEEVAVDPKFSVTVGGVDWAAVDDFGDSGPSSKHVVVREDVDYGWGVQFGTGRIGQVPTAGASVVLTYRTDSLVSGDLAAGTPVSFSVPSPHVQTPTLPRGTTGYRPAEASDAQSILDYMQRVVATGNLEKQSVTTAADVESAMTGGASGRATFLTSDGRAPFSRARVVKQGRFTRIVCVGLKVSPTGEVSSDDLTEAAEWLNGVQAGITTVGGRGVTNGRAIVVAFSPRSFWLVVTIATNTTYDVRTAVATVIENLLRPHAQGDNGEYRWDFGRNIPVALLFALVWNSVERYIDKKAALPMSLYATDGTNTWNVEDSIPVLDEELPTLHPSWNPDSHITVVRT